MILSKLEFGALQVQGKIVDAFLPIFSYQCYRIHLRSVSNVLLNCATTEVPQAIEIED